MRKIFSLIIGLLPTMFFIGSVAADGMLSSTPLSFSGKPPATPQKTVIVTPVKPVVSAGTKMETDPRSGTKFTVTSAKAIPYPSWIGGFGNNPTENMNETSTATARHVQRVPSCGCAQPVNRDRPTRRSIIRAYYERMKERAVALMS